VRAHLTEQYGAFNHDPRRRRGVGMGLFGPATPAERSLERIGDLVLLPHQNYYFHHYPTPRRRTCTG